MKNLVLIYVKENRLVDADYSKQIFYFSKYFNFIQKKYTFQTCMKYKCINVTHF